MYEAIGKVNRINADIATLYPSENNKVVYYSGTFSGNVPESRATAVLKVTRVISEKSEEIQLYQEWEAYDANSPYCPSKYIRFGYFTGSVSPTWSAWQRVQRGIKFIDKTITNITLNAQGYFPILNKMPSGMTNFLFAVLYDFGTVSTNDAVGINCNGRYVFGSANAVITRIGVRYFYTD